MPYQRWYVAPVVAKLVVTPVQRIIGSAIGMLLLVIGVGSVREDTAAFIHLLGPVGIILTTQEGAALLLLLGFLLIVYANFGTTVKHDLIRIADEQARQRAIAIAIDTPDADATVPRVSEVSGTVDPPETDVAVFVLSRDGWWWNQNFKVPPVTWGKTWRTHATLGDGTAPPRTEYVVVAVAGGGISEKKVRAIPADLPQSPPRRVFLSSPPVLVDAAPQPSGDLARPAGGPRTLAAMAEAARGTRPSRPHPRGLPPADSFAKQAHETRSRYETWEAQQLAWQAIADREAERRRIEEEVLKDFDFEGFAKTLNNLIPQDPQMGTRIPRPRSEHAIRAELGRERVRLILVTPQATE